MTALRRLTTTEARLFSREPVDWGLALVFPSLLLLILGVIPAFRSPEEGIDGVRMIEFYPPVMIAIGITMIALVTLPQRLAVYREKGVLRRMRITPVGPRQMLGAQLALSMVLSLVTTVLLLVVARVVFSVELPQQPLALLLGFTLTAAAMLAMGLLVASLARTGTSAQAIGTVLLFPLMFVAGMWIPRASMNDVLLRISDLSPLGAGVQTLQDAATGQWPQPLHLVVLLAWTVVCGGLAARYFRWE